MPYLETPILYLRALEPEDLEWLYAIENDKELWDSTSTNLPLSRYALKQYISQQPQDIYQCGEIRLAICLKEDDTPIGLADLINFEPVHSHAEVGITILAKHQNKGYGKMVLQLLEEYAEKKMHLHQLFAYVSAETNIASTKLFLSASYTPIAVLPQWFFINGEYVDITFFQKILKKNR